MNTVIEVNATPPTTRGGNTLARSACASMAAHYTFRRHMDKAETGGILYSLAKADNGGMDVKKEDDPLAAICRKVEGIANGAERARVLAEIDCVEKLISGKAVTGITGDEFKKDPAKDLRTQVVEYFNSIGRDVYREGVGAVLLNKDGVKSSIAHGMSRVKAAAFKAVADIIKHGITIDRQTNWKGRGYDTELIDAVIDIGGTDYIAEVIINKYKDGINEYYLHELEKKTKLQGLIQTGLVTGGPEASKLIIAQKLEKVKDTISDVNNKRYVTPRIN